MATSSGTLEPGRARIVATIEARMTSSRLPGKVLADVGGVPLLAMMIERLGRSQLLSGICVATTTNESDDAVEALAESLGVGCFRGSEDDVLGRVLGAARAVDADVIVETTGDCPMIDPAVLDAVVLGYFADDVHYCANNLAPRTFPRGLDVQAFSTDLLAEVDGRTDDPADREHVSLYIYEVAGRYRVKPIQAVGRLRSPDRRWTVDTSDDLAFVRAVVGELGHHFSSADAVDLLERRPDIESLNAHVEQKAVR